MKELLSLSIQKEEENNKNMDEILKFMFIILMIFSKRKNKWL